MLDTPSTPHAPMPAPTGTTPSVLPTQRAALNAPVVTALVGLVSVTAAALAGVFALVGAL